MILPDVSPVSNVSNTGTGKPLVNGQTSSEVSLDLSWSPGRSGGLASFFVRGISGSGNPQALGVMFPLFLTWKSGFRFEGWSSKAGVAGTSTLSVGRVGLGLQMCSSWTRGPTLLSPQCLLLLSSAQDELLNQLSLAGPALRAKLSCISHTIHPLDK